MEKGLKGDMTLDGDNSVTLCTRSIQGLHTARRRRGGGGGAAWYGLTAVVAVAAVVGREGSRVVSKT
jgi:hypothetical protein